MEGAQSPNLYSIHIEGRFDISVIWAFGRSPVLRSLIFRHRGNPIKISKQKQVTSLPRITRLEGDLLIVQS